MVYQKACEIDPTEKRKKPVIVTEVYDPPLPAETDRGRSGEYIKLLRPLLVSQVAFEGKLCALCNQIGLFTAYTEKLKDNPVVQRKIAAIKHENDLDIWQPEFYPKIGERYYASILKGNLRRRIKYALDSLQRQTIVRWKEITRIVPDISTETDEGAEERPETQSETDERMQIIKELVNNVYKHAAATFIHLEIALNEESKLAITCQNDRAKPNDIENILSSKGGMLFLTVLINGNGGNIQYLEKDGILTATAVLGRKNEDITI